MDAADSPEKVVLWEPQPGPQTSLITCPADDIFYGGARGGGKTDGVLGDWLIHAGTHGRHSGGIVIRRDTVQLEEMIARSQELFYPLGAKWHEQKKWWVMPGGARLKFRYLENDRDAMHYQGHSYTRIYPEEMTNFPTPGPIDKMRATLRSAHGIPCKVVGTGNPGGPGHQWVKERYIQPNPMGYQLFVIKLPKGKQITRCFIPAKLKDNLILTANDPDYEARLHLVGSDALVKAWLEGDWDAVEGAYFDCWSVRMILAPFKIPAHWTRFMSMDWGSARPYSVGWWAIAENEPIETEFGTIMLPRGSLIRYRELYGCARRQDGLAVPNVGVKQDPEQIAREIWAREPLDEVVAYRVGGIDMFDHSKGPSIAETMFRYVPENRKHLKVGMIWRKADTKRVPGWSQMRLRMNGFDNIPMIYVFGTCIDSIRTIPPLQHDPAKAEDLDTESEDHPADEWRYACMSRPMSLVKIKERRVLINPYSMDRLAPVVIKEQAQYSRYDLL